MYLTVQRKGVVTGEVEAHFRILRACKQCKLFRHIIGFENMFVRRASVYQQRRWFVKDLWCWFSRQWNSQYAGGGSVLVENGLILGQGV
jgi:hypothetical protein